MRCFFCKGEMKDEASTFMTEMGKSILIVKDVPSLVCKQCGEVAYGTEAMKRLEEIVISMKQVMTEIAVVSFPDHAA